MKYEKPKPDETTREFASVLLELPDAHGQAGVELQHLIAAVKATGKPGTLTLKLAVSLLPQNDEVVVIKPTVTNSPPKFDVRAGTFYVDKHSNPVRDDPNRMDIFGAATADEKPAADETLVDVDTATGELKELDQ